jgi:hypothetical protein
VYVFVYVSVSPAAAIDPLTMLTMELRSRMMMMMCVSSSSKARHATRHLSFLVLLSRTRSLPVSQVNSSVERVRGGTDFKLHDVDVIAKTTTSTRACERFTILHLHHPHTRRRYSRPSTPPSPAQGRKRWCWTFLIPGNGSSKAKTTPWISHHDLWPLAFASTSCSGTR